MNSFLFSKTSVQSFVKKFLIEVLRLLHIVDVEGLCSKVAQLEQRVETLRRNLVDLIESIRDKDELISELQDQM